MTTNERLDRISAKCRELLALAEKKTQFAVSPPAYSVENAAYIAACAGAAEAGWRSTLAAIDALRQLETDPAIPELFRTQHTFALTRHILAAWPEELL